MPTTPRKSSLAVSRRGTLKAHIPYRGDNPEVGKKTGIAVQHVARQSDGFEPFEKVLQQADVRTPPRRKGKKKSLAAASHHQDEDDYGDDGGEESMQLDSPIQNMVNARLSVSPAKSLRRKSSIRPVARTSHIDYDKIPSPRRAPASVSPDPDDQDIGMDSDFNDYAPQESRSPQRVSPRKTSFGRIEEEEEEEEQQEVAEEEEERQQDTPSKHKGKRKATVYEDPDHDVEDEIAQELENVELGMGSGDSEEEPQPPVKKTKTEAGNPPKAKTQSRAKKENRSPRPGVRKSQREHYKPLEYWRGEKLVYGRSRHSGPILVPQIKEIIRIPKDVIVPLGSKRKRSVTRARSQSKTVEAGEDVIRPALPVVDPEEGWDDNTKAKCAVIHFTTKEEVERRIAWTAKMVEPRQATNHSWSFDKIFGDDDFIAAGQLIIPPKGRKPSKAAKDNTYVFYVIQGAVNFKIHDTSMILATGGMFMVPRGNTYFIENIGDRDAKLFFTQARKVELSKEELASRTEAAAEVTRRKSATRSSPSVGSLSAKKLPTPNGRAASGNHRPFY